MVKLTCSGPRLPTRTTLLTRDLLSWSSQASVQSVFLLFITERYNVLDVKQAAGKYPQKNTIVPENVDRGQEHPGDIYSNIADAKDNGGVGVKIDLGTK